MPKKPANSPLYDAIKDRGRLFLTVYRVLLERHDKSEAISIMRSASYKFGLGIGKPLACFAPRDFVGMADAYAKSPDNGVTYSPEIKRLNNTCLEFQIMTCPIKDAWVEAGCSDEEICTLLHCAAPQDEATLQAAGFDYEIELWSPGKTGCCHTIITEKSSTESGHSNDDH